jgi:hypothetical protein
MTALAISLAVMWGLGSALGNSVLAAKNKAAKMLHRQPQARSTTW